MIALHARTVQQHYSGEARWDAIGELKQAVGSIPVLGNGDIWEADDAVRMMAATGCDGVVIGRGCLGRPWLFGDLVEVLSGRPAPESRPLGVVMDVMLDHARLLSVHMGENHAMRDFRKHAGWYMSGYPVGPEVRRRFSMVASLSELEDVLAGLDPTARVVAGRRAHQARPHERSDQGEPARRLARRPRTRASARRRHRARRRRRDGPLRRLRPRDAGSCSRRRRRAARSCSRSVGLEFEVRAADIDESVAAGRVADGVRPPAVDREGRRGRRRARTRSSSPPTRPSRSTGDPRQAGRRRRRPPDAGGCCPARTHRVHTGVTVAVRRAHRDAGRHDAS